MCHHALPGIGFVSHNRASNRLLATDYRPLPFGFVSHVSPSDRPPTTDDRLPPIGFVSHGHHPRNSSHLTLETSNLKLLAGLPLFDRRGPPAGTHSRSAEPLRICAYPISYVIFCCIMTLHSRRFLVKRDSGSSPIGFRGAPYSFRRPQLTPGTRPGKQGTWRDGREFWYRHKRTGVPGPDREDPRPDRPPCPAAGPKEEAEK